MPSENTIRVHTFRPLALLIALRGLSTLNTLRIFTTLMAPLLETYDITGYVQGTYDRTTCHHRLCT